MKLGARMLKTGLAVAIALYAASLLGFPSPVFAGIAAIFAIQPSIYRSFQTILEQFQANIIGVGVAMLVVFTLGNDPFVIGFTAILVIGICMYLKMSETTVSLALVAVIAIMESTEMTFVTFAMMRFSALTLGIFSAFLVNLLFLPPKYETKLFQRVDRTTADILQWLRITTRHLSDEPALKGEIKRIQTELRQIDQTYLLFSEERTYLRKNHLSKARKLIVFRQLIATTKKSFDVLKAFHQLDEKIESIPTKFPTALVEELDKVIHSHERLLLSSMGRIKKKHKQTLQDISEPDIPNLVEELIQVYRQDEDNHLIFLPLASQLMEYHHNLQHLQILLKSYQQYHEDEHLEFMKRD
ncbi:FUSC family protein [Aquibacillus rhizosphaerae]|uniref:Aromatic acid exporter family protein n=1 Tax=Aquibacillus rhizosphaerae TaxID=3051431 RepID=A0ABT7L7N7_9BACI|nr:aromatic acid exporter family protein [Aquibacillus sp. LR5S19]MDL4841877.1 aromatic acid exporter family protein [Aquibacillus sp. LR5S19]